SSRWPRRRCRSCSRCWCARRRSPGPPGCSTAMARSASRRTWHSHDAAPRHPPAADTAVSAPIRPSGCTRRAPERLRSARSPRRSSSRRPSLSPFAHCPPSGEPDRTLQPACPSAVCARVLGRILWRSGIRSSTVQSALWEVDIVTSEAQARIRLLGPVEVSTGGRLVDVGHARQRSVLAVLLAARRGRTTVEQLIDRVWGDHPPPRARHVLHSYLSRLRRLLAAARVATLPRARDGYWIEVDPSS